MKYITKYLTPVVKQFMALNARERAWSIVALLGIIYFVFDFAFLKPQNAEAKALRLQIEQQNAEMTGFTKALDALSAVGRPDPLAAQRAERDELRNTFTQAEAVIGHAQIDVRLMEVIRSMTATRSGLTLVSLKTVPVIVFFKPPALPVSAFDGKPAQEPQISFPTLYKHGIEVTVQGSYPTLIAYMQELERSAKGVFWGDVKIDVVAYPDATLKMTIHTLSARQDLPLG